ncbi:hypothetical protein pb186bvf_000152 [Paramecium bursaria]
MTIAKKLCVGQKQNLLLILTEKLFQELKQIYCVLQKLILNLLMNNNFEQKAKAAKQAQKNQIEILLQEFIISQEEKQDKKDDRKQLTEVKKKIAKKEQQKQQNQQQNEQSSSSDD